MTKSMNIQTRLVMLIAKQDKQILDMDNAQTFSGNLQRDA